MHVFGARIQIFHQILKRVWEMRDPCVKQQVRHLMTVKLTVDFRIPVLLQCLCVYTSQCISPESLSSNYETEGSLPIKEL